MSEPAVFEEAVSMIRDGARLKAVETLLAAIPQLSTDFHRRAYGLAGLAFYFDQQWGEAIGMFQSAATGSEVPEDWFNLAMAQIKAGSIADAKANWQRVFDLSYAHQDAPATSTFFEKKLMFAQALQDAGACDDLGLDLLERQLLPFFTTYRITDTHVWASRGVPDFQQVLVLLREYYRALGKPLADWTALCDRVAEQVDDEGRELCTRLRVDWEILPGAES